MVDEFYLHRSLKLPIAYRRSLHSYRGRSCNSPLMIFYHILAEFATSWKPLGCDHGVGGLSRCSCSEFETEVC